MTANIVHATDENFEKTLIEAAGRTVLVDFHASWCGPCKGMAPALDALAKAHPNLLVVKVDVDTAQATSARVGIRSVPTLVLHKDGVDLERRVGAMALPQLQALVAKAL